MALNDDISELIAMAREESEPNRIRNSDEYEELFNKVDHKSLVIDEIENKLGCPIEVRSSIYNAMKVYYEDGHTYKVIDIDFNSMGVDGITTLGMRTIPYSEYGKSWWLKQDRSK